MKVEELDFKRLPLTGNGENPYPIDERVIAKAKVVSKYMVGYLQPLMKPEYKFFWNVKSAQMLSDIVEMEMLGHITHRQGRDIVQSVVKEIKTMARK